MEERLRKRIDTVKDRVPIWELIRDMGFVAGEVAAQKDFQLKCPFHGKDNKPSSHVYSDGHFHCYTCKIHYDVIAFVERAQGLKFRDAVTWLEDRYGIERPKFEVETKLPFDDKRKSISQDPDSKPRFAYSALYSYVERKLMQNKKTLGFDYYSKALFALDLTKENENIASLEALEGKIDAKLAVQS